eukprot:4009900-Pyramimonas_sp.AAC.1
MPAVSHPLTGRAPGHPSSSDKPATRPQLHARVLPMLRKGGRPLQEQSVRVPYASRYAEASGTMAGANHRTHTVSQTSGRASQHEQGVQVGEPTQVPNS